MKIEIPETWRGIPIKGAIERALAGEGKEKEKQETKSIIQAPNKDNYIYVPSSNIYVAKQRSHLGLNWYDTHKTLHQENLLMPTIPQFLEYINYLKQNLNGIQDASKQEIESILDDILTFRNPWRSEWLDAKFEKKNKKLYINYAHRTDSKGDLVPQKSELLEKCLMKDNWADVLAHNKQGLPTKKLSKDKGGIYYRYPRENSVAGFRAVSGRADLGCVGGPGVSDASLGVFVCLPKAGP